MFPTYRNDLQCSRCTRSPACECPFADTSAPQTFCESCHLVWHVLKGLRPPEGPFAEGAKR